MYICVYCGLVDPSSSAALAVTFLFTARKNGFALSLIRIKGVVKCNNSFDTTFDAHQIISQRCDAFTYTFDSNQR